MRSRTILEDMYIKEGDHWIWQGKTSRGVPRICNDTAIRRLLVEDGRDLSGSFVKRVCDEALCVNPDHYEVRAYSRLSTSRVCCVCRESKSDGEYEPTPSGRGHTCRECRASIDRERKLNSRDLVRARTLAIKRECLDYYGPSCGCCGEDKEIFLCFDHINEDGNLHRAEDVSARYLPIWLKKNGFPPGFQVLCQNCNFAKSRGGCPHGSPAGQPPRSL